MKLTKRERQIITLVAEARTNCDIGAALGISEGTVKVYLSRLYSKLAINRAGNSRVNAALYAFRNGLAPVPVAIEECR